MDLNGDINPAAGAGLPAPAASSKRCRKCGDEKPLSEFYEHKRGVTAGQHSRLCKPCDRSYCKLIRPTTLAKRKSRMLDKDYAESVKGSRLGWKIRVRRDVMAAYGNACACCGEAAQEFLAIDHIFGGGAAHKREIGGNFYQWLRRNGYPSGFRILCHNCNQARGIYGRCPHEVAAYDVPFAVRMESVNHVDGGHGSLSGVNGRAV